MKQPKTNNVIDINKKLPKHIDCINYFAVDWCERMLDNPTEDDIQWTENYIADLLLNFGERFQRHTKKNAAPCMRGK